MRRMRHIFIFIANDISRLRRKWLTLPLIFISPIIFIILLLWMLSSLISFDDGETMPIGLVNLDESDETSMIVSALANSGELADGLEIQEITQDTAEEMIAEDELASYIIFPEQFFTKMMRGKSSELEVAGNPDRQLESYVVSGVIDTVVRHIQNSQADILTINHYAKEFGMPEEDRQALIFKEFTNQFIQVLSSHTLMNEYQTSQNISTGYVYFVVNGMFIIITLWIYIIYTALVRDVNDKLADRMKLMGATHLIQGFSKVLVTGTIITAISSILIFIMMEVGVFNIVFENILRVIALLTLHIFITTVVLLIIDWVIPSFKASMVIQLVTLLLILLFSGSIIPRIYFPIYLDPLFNYIYSYQALNWTEEIILNTRFTLQIDILMITLAVFTLMLIVIGWLKERRYS